MAKCSTNETNIESPLLQVHPNKAVNERAGRPFVHDQNFAPCPTRFRKQLMTLRKNFGKMHQKMAIAISTNLPPHSHQKNLPKSSGVKQRGPCLVEGVPMIPGPNTSEPYSSNGSIEWLDSITGSTDLLSPRQVWRYSRWVPQTPEHHHPPRLTNKNGKKRNEVKKRGISVSSIFLSRENDWTFIKFRIATKSFHIKYLFIRSELLRVFVEAIFSWFPLFVDEDMSFSTRFFNPVAFRERITAPCTNRRMNKFRTLVPISAKHWRRWWLQKPKKNQEDSWDSQFERILHVELIECIIENWSCFFMAKVWCTVYLCFLCIRISTENLPPEQANLQLEVGTGHWRPRENQGVEQNHRARPGIQIKISPASVSYEVFVFSWPSHWMTGDQLKISECSAIVDVTIPILMGRSRKSFTPAIFAIQYELVKKIVSSV